MSDSKDSAPAARGWDWTHFLRPDGGPILNAGHIAETMTHSAAHNDANELWGVTLHGTNTVVCYTGNGPNSRKHARLIAGMPAYREAFERIANISHGEAQRQALEVLRWMDAEPDDGYELKPKRIRAEGAVLNSPPEQS